jgi:hypothetical protein
MKAGLITPAYLSISWVLTVSYQLLTEIAVRTIGVNFGLLNSDLGLWINTNIQTIMFVYAFTWIFVLSSVIPSVILGKQRSVIVQYAVVLTLSLISLFMPDILLGLTGFDVRSVADYAVFLQNPLIAGLYLSIPYFFMLGLDLRSRNSIKNRKNKELVDQLKIESRKQRL